ncbi:hypothetical protein M0R89_09260 [Halorussus limi]|uniref:Uncharacterized protein n=1 Tax=Halorussus limi TaxID=2938695 RepID=A0A8U0HPR4_9EURY|nr:hypothetical protein [Halorussus limi]UPV72736.1 hypothetical protein M0R89_09260 [Halorussus limi]
MDEDFITNGLESDRYLKATKLVHSFESEVTETINQVCREIIDVHSELFDEDVDLEEKVLGADASQTLATNRTEFAMNFENEDGDNPKLNIALEWVEPGQQNEEAGLHGGSLCYAMYKIQHGSEARFETVRECTESQDRWDQLRFGEDQWYHYSKHAPGIVYLPVESGQEFVDALQTLRRHFSKEYAPLISEQTPSS